MQSTPLFVSISAQKVAFHDDRSSSQPPLISIIIDTQLSKIIDAFVNCGCSRIMIHHRSILDQNLASPTGKIKGIPFSRQLHYEAQHRP